MPPLHKPTVEQRKVVQAMSAYGLTHEEISNVIGIDRNTLAKHYRPELSKAEATANAKVAERLYDKAMSGDIKAIMFWLERRGGDPWRHKPLVQIVPGDFTIDMNPTNAMEMLPEQIVMPEEINDDDN